MALLEAKGIVKRFSGVLALDNVNFACEKGKITGLLGANGSGKSTLSKIITGVYHADKGEILYEGKPVRFANPKESKTGGISMIFQNLSLVEDLTVWQNIVLGCEQRQGLYLDNKWAQKRSQEIMDQLWPELDIHRLVYQLSPGEMQIVEIAKALICEPRLLIMDEPTAALEREQVQSLFACIRRLAQQDVAIIFTSHRMKEVMEICDNVIVFKNGKNVGELDFATDERDEDAVVRLIAGESDRKKHQRPNREINEEVMLSAEHLKLGRKLNDVSITLHKGEILGIGGLSGQGQEELMLALAGNYANLGGELQLMGKKIRLSSPSKAINQNIFLVPGDRNAEGLMLEHSVQENLDFPRLTRKGHSPLISHRRNAQEDQEIVRRLAVKTKDLHAAVSTLSGGNAQKVVIGKWLNFPINVLLLADPAKGVDVGAKHDMYALVRELSEKNGTSVVLYASDTEELIEQCDRVLVMFEGRIVAELEGEHINEKEIYAATMNVKSEGSNQE